VSADEVQAMSSTGELKELLVSKMDYARYPTKQNMSVE
jgi:hypothetical protein